MIDDLPRPHPSSHRNSQTVRKPTKRDLYARLEDSLRLAHGGLDVQGLDVLPLLLAVDWESPDQPRSL